MVRCDFAAWSNTHNNDDDDDVDDERIKNEAVCGLAIAHEPIGCITNEKESAPERSSSEHKEIRAIKSQESPKKALRQEKSTGKRIYKHTHTHTIT